MNQADDTPSPLQGTLVLELGGIGPVPFAGMLLADWGARVVRLERASDMADDYADWHRALLRGRESVSADLRTEAGRQLAIDLASRADIVLEGFRPGVADRLGVGPAQVRAVNRRAVYGQMTGWGQSGPLSASAGHDINYLAASGLLDCFRATDGEPRAPLNLLGDFGAGAMLLACGVLLGLLEARRTGDGTVVDASIADGLALMGGMLESMRGTGRWPGEPGSNVLDGGAPYYRTYRTSDDRFIAVGALEPKFWDEFVRGLGIEDSILGMDRTDRASWPLIADLVARVVAAAPLAHWVDVFAGHDACVTVVEPSAEAASDRYALRAGVREPLPAPRLDGRRPALPPPAPRLGEHTDQVLEELARP